MVKDYSDSKEGNVLFNNTLIHFIYGYIMSDIQ